MESEKAQKIIDRFLDLPHPNIKSESLMELNREVESLSSNNPEFENLFISMGEKAAVVKSFRESNSAIQWEWDLPYATIAQVNREIQNIFERIDLEPESVRGDEAFWEVVEDYEGSPSIMEALIGAQLRLLGDTWDSEVAKFKANREMMPFLALIKTWDTEGFDSAMEDWEPNEAGRYTPEEKLIVLKKLNALKALRQETWELVNAYVQQNSK